MTGKDYSMENQENQVTEETVSEEVATEESEAPEVEETPTSPADEVEGIVQERLSKMKENMDRMSKERDEALKMKADMEAKAKEEAIARMKEEGKLQEALELEVADLKAKLHSYEEQNTALSRDNVLNQALAGMEFRNDTARDMARSQIVNQLTSEEGVWKHSSGMNIQDFVESYAKSEENSFLFRVKANAGAGTGTPAGAPSTEQTKSLSDMSSQEMLALAAKGKLGSFGY